MFTSIPLAQVLRGTASPRYGYDVNRHICSAGLASQLTYRLVPAAVMFIHSIGNPGAL